MEEEGLEKQILHYKKYLEKYVERPDAEEKVVYILHKLNKLAVTVELLADTGIGRAVNKYRKNPSADIKERARDLVSKWRQLIPPDDEEEPRNPPPSDAPVRVKQEQTDKVKVKVEATVASASDTDHSSSDHVRIKREREDRSTENSEHDAQSDAHSDIGSDGDNRSFTAVKIKQERSTKSARQAVRSRDESSSSGSQLNHAIQVKKEKTAANIKQEHRSPERTSNHKHSEKVRDGKHSDKHSEKVRDGKHSDKHRSKEHYPEKVQVRCEPDSSVKVKSEYDTHNKVKVKSEPVDEQLKAIKSSHQSHGPSRGQDQTCDRLASKDSDHHSNRDHYSNRECQRESHGKVDDNNARQERREKKHRDRKDKTDRKEKHKHHGDNVDKVKYKPDSDRTDNTDSQEKHKHHSDRTDKGESKEKQLKDRYDSKDKHKHHSDKKNKLDNRDKHKHHSDKKDGMEERKQDKYLGSEDKIDRGKTLCVGQKSEVDVDDVVNDDAWWDADPAEEDTSAVVKATASTQAKARKKVVDDVVNDDDWWNSLADEEAGSDGDGGEAGEGANSVGDGEDDVLDDAWWDAAPVDDDVPRNQSHQSDPSATGSGQSSKHQDQQSKSKHASHSKSSSHEKHRHGNDGQSSSSHKSKQPEVQPSCSTSYVSDKAGQHSSRRSKHSMSPEPEDNTESSKRHPSNHQHKKDHDSSRSKEGRSSHESKQSKEVNKSSHKNRESSKLGMDKPGQERGEKGSKRKLSESLNEENPGLSFDDFLNFDVAPVAKKKPKLASKSLESSKLSTSKQAEHHSSHSDSKHSSSTNHLSKDKHKSHHKSESSKSDHKSSRSEHKSSRSEHKSSRSDPKSSESGRGVSSRSSSSQDEAPKFNVPKPPEKVDLSFEDIVPSEPVLTSNYKPLPRLDLDEGKARRKSLCGMNTSEVLSSIGIKKNERTQVYSGRKVTHLSSVPTLIDSCLRVLADNIDSIDHVGLVPYDLLKPVLQKCSASQLYTIEDSNPQFIGDTDELWEIHSTKDFRGCNPDEFESWRELYLRKYDEREEKFKKLTADISAAAEARKAPVRKTKLAYVDSVVKPPRGVLRQQMRHGTAGSMGKKDPLAKLSSHGGKKERPPVPNPAGPSARQRLQKEVRTIAPMMAKSLRLMKNLRR